MIFFYQCAISILIYLKVTHHLLAGQDDSVPWCQAADHRYIIWMVHVLLVCHTTFPVPFCHLVGDIRWPYFHRHQLGNRRSSIFNIISIIRHYVACTSGKLGSHTAAIPTLIVSIGYTIDMVLDDLQNCMASGSGRRSY